VIFRALTAASRRLLEGEHRAVEIARQLRETIESERCLRVDYAEVVDARTLRPFAGGKIEVSPHGALLAVAAFAGETRLIDNVVVGPD
jgi:pantoate--beta-alanine ligase